MPEQMTNESWLLFVETSDNYFITTTPDTTNKKYPRLGLLEPLMWNGYVNEIRVSTVLEFWA